MTAMALDEIQQGPARQRRRRPPPGWLLGVVIAAVVAVGVWTALRPGSLASPSASPAPAPRPTAVAPSPSTVAQLVHVGAVCKPVTDGARTLTVSFTVVSLASTPITLADIHPSLPMGGLTTLSSTVEGGTCDAPDPTSAGRRLAPGGSAAVVFTFRLPRECPAPYPVQAYVLVGVGDGVVADGVPVLADLGGVDFTACRSG
jgi:hypothetical protein